MVGFGWVGVGRSRTRNVKLGEGKGRGVDALVFSQMFSMRENCR